MNFVRLKKEKDKVITIFNYRRIDQENISQEGVINVFLESNFSIVFENIKSFMSMSNYSQSEKSLQELISDSLEKQEGEVYFYLDENETHNPLIEKLTEENGLDFNNNKAQNLYLYIPKSLEKESFQNVPLKNIEVI